MTIFALLTDILFVGHSLIGTDLPDLVEGGMRQMREPATVSAQIINGAPLKFNFENSQGAQGVDGKVELAKGQTDVLILTEAIPLATQIQWNDTAGQIAAYAALARGANPDVRVFVYETWHSRTSGPGTVIEGDDGAGLPWRDRLTADLSQWESVVRDGARLSDTQVSLIPGGQAMALLSESVAEGKVPGVTSMDTFFSDDIHLSAKGTYYMALVHLAAITGKSPEGLPAQLTRRWKSREAVVPDDLARVLQRLAWQAVSTYTPSPPPLVAPTAPAQTNEVALETHGTVPPSDDPLLAPSPAPDGGVSVQPLTQKESVAPTASAPSFAPITNPNLAIGLNGIADWTVQQPFLDVMKTAREWTGNLPNQFGGWDHAQLAAAGVLDESGWPKSIPPELASLSLLILTDLPADAGGVAGRYLLTFEGKGKLEIGGRAQNVVMSDTQALFDYTPGDGTVALTITQTDAADPLRNFTLVREDRAALLAQGQIFNPDWLARIRGVKTIRFMDWMRTNNSTLARLGDRPKPSDYTWTRLGAPIEIVIELANELNANPWINIPHLAEDSLITFYAETTRDTLAPGLVAHVEFSNEVWNWGFSQASWAEEQGKARWGRESTWVQYYALRASQMADIWAQTFGDQADSRLIRILATQTGWIGLEDQILNAPDVLAEGKPSPAKHFDAYAITGYFSALLGSEEKAPMVRDWIRQSEAQAKAQAQAKGLTGTEASTYLAKHRYDLAFTLAAEELANGSLSGDPSDSLDDVTGRILPYQADIARQHNLTLMMYEGGTHVVGYAALVEDQTLTDFFTALNYAPEMAKLYNDLMASWAKLTPAPFNAFVDVAAPSRWGSWGALRHLTDDNPRWQVLAKGCLAC
ncbi:MAG: hypothetical protein K9G71_00605 [Rhodobacteraceae bacterium]|nr:hypothetical protein [Paracoccaceae bacterium]MCF8512824.1 hypothetical protein [Paracoccaceae bacterium]MCF8517069.1 hypothetical protein [Paracoccaceae bacterium]